MIVHENVELLSSFVDGELEAPLRRAVESHLADCPRCQERISGLRRVVEELQALEVVAPPADLSGRIRRAALLDGKRAGGLWRSAESLRRWTGQPLLLPLFGVVTAMAVLLYLFTAWSDRAGQPGTRVVVGSSRDAPAVEMPVDGTVARLAGRTFERNEGRWIERGVDPGEVAAILDLGRPGTGSAELEVLRPLGGRVVLRDGDRVVEVLFGPEVR